MTFLHSKRHRQFLLVIGLATLILLIVLLAQLTTGALLADSSSNGPVTLDWGTTKQPNTLTPTTPTTPTSLESVEGAVANCRYGLTTLSTTQIALLDEFGSGAYLNFGYRSWSSPNGSQYLPLIHVWEEKNGFDYLGIYGTRPSIKTADQWDQRSLLHWLTQYPGQVWNIGNEYDRGPNPGEPTGGQGDVNPEVYAEALHDTADYIRRYDPTATIVLGGVVQITPIRLAYLDVVWQTHIQMYGYPPQVDAFAMHLYVLPEVNPQGQPNAIANIPVGMESQIHLAKRESGGDPAQCPDPDVYCYAEHDDISVFAEQIVAMRQWMKNRGEQNKPLMITEFSLLYPYFQDPGGTCFLQDEYGNCFTPERVQAFLQASYDYLDTAVDSNLGYPKDGNRLVQTSVWFSINHDVRAGSVSNFYDNGPPPDYPLTTINDLGQQFVDRVSGMPVTINLFTESAGYPYAATDGSGTADVDIWATFRNNGNAHVQAPFDFTFYRNAALTDAIGTATVTPNINISGCALAEYRSTLTWNDLAPGEYDYWAKIDSNNVVSETDESDNVIRGKVTVGGDVSSLPILIRP